MSTMYPILWIFALFFLLISTSGSKSHVPKIECRNYDDLIAITSEYKYVEVNLNDTFILECHYCSGNDTNIPKIWFKIPEYNNTPTEVIPGMHNNMSLNRIIEAFDHSLIVKKVAREDAGIYYCHSDLEEDDENIFRYVIDVVFGNETVEIGNLSVWEKYKELNFDTINKKFLNSNVSDFRYVRTVLGLQIEVVTEWEEDWGKCDACGRSQGKGIQEKRGYCRVKTIQGTKNESARNLTEKMLYFLNITQISCRSLLLQELFPSLSHETRLLPNFIQTRFCNDVCSPDDEGSDKGWKFGTTKGYKYRKIIILAEKSHFTAICPESTLEDVVIWRRNGKELERGATTLNDNNEPHVLVDTFNTLYLIDVTGGDEGNYSCQVNDIRMQQIRVYVVSKMKLLTKAFLRHMMYLGFILSLSSSCYCAGLIVAWSKRRSFKSYEEVMKEIKEERKYTPLYLEDV